MPKTFAPETDIPDLDGKVILITGGNAGIGAATVQALALHKPECIYLCARNRSTAEALVVSIHEHHAAAKIHVLQLDLASFESIKKCAAEFNEKSERLDIVFLNAGVASVAPSLTTEGYEFHFGVNHMGHALLMQLLMPKMLDTIRQNAGADVRIVTTSSMGASSAPKCGLALDKMQQSDPFWHTFVRYGHSKLANILFARKLSQLYPSISSTSVHPGIVKSEIWGRADGGKFAMMLMAPLVWATGITVEEGAKTQLWCATAPKGEVQSGKFYVPIGQVSEATAHGSDEALMEELWQWTNGELAKHGAPGWPQQ